MVRSRISIFVVIILEDGDDLVVLGELVAISVGSGIAMATEAIVAISSSVRSRDGGEGVCRTPSGRVLRRSQRNRHLCSRISDDMADGDPLVV